MIYSLLWPFIHCYYADRTTDRIFATGTHLYGLDWFRFSIANQKHVALIIARSQQRQRFSGHGLVYCSLEVLGNVSALKQKCIGLIFG